jgi:hypothetical protein
MIDSDEYGFFCDIENAKIMEYDKHEYYIVTKTTHWEVRRMSIEQNTKNPVSNKSAKISRLITPSKRVDTLQNEIHGFWDTNNAEECKEDEPEKNKCICFPLSFRLLSFIRRIPREVYYSVAVCVTTVSCVCFVMTFPII